MPDPLDLSVSKIYILGLPYWKVIPRTVLFYPKFSVILHGIVKDYSCKKLKVPNDNVSETTHIQEQVLQSGYRKK